MKRRNTLGIVASLVMCISCGKDARPAPARNAALRTELLSRYETDQAARTSLANVMRTGLMPPDSVLRQITQVDSSNSAWLKRQIAQSGWPTRAEVDSDGVNAALMLLQHVDADTAFQAHVFPMVEGAYHNGDVSGSMLALLADRMSTARGLPQEYGTQADVRNNHVFFKPIRDSANVDSRRKKMGMPTLQSYLWTLDSAYFGRMHH